MSSPIEYLQQLQALLRPHQVSIERSDLEGRSKDHSFHVASFGEFVVWPESTLDVQQVLRWANERGVAVTPWGQGTSIEGNPIPLRGGIVLDLSRMNRVLEVWPDDLQVEVQPGLTRLELNAGLAPLGLFFPPDPGANASIGGMIGNNAAGAKAVAYGATRHNVLRMEVVLASGEVIRVGTRARKNSCGYDLLNLMIGSEGTLGVVTQATLKLSPVPQNVASVLAAFPSVSESLSASQAIMRADLRPTALEFIDSETVGLLSSEGGLDLTAGPNLLVDVSGPVALAEVKGICRQFGAVSVQAVVGFAERDKLWQARYATYHCLVRRHPEETQLILDVAVPVSRYAEIVGFADATLAELGLTGYKWGHAGDGNLHVNIVFTAEGWERAKEADDLIVRKAISLDGTATGEHGVGIGKRGYLAEQYGVGVDVMRRVKATLDPNGILNPGKVV